MSSNHDFYVLSVQARQLSGAAQQLRERVNDAPRDFGLRERCTCYLQSIELLADMVQRHLETEHEWREGAARREEAGTAPSGPTRIL